MEFEFEFIGNSQFNYWDKVWLLQRTKTILLGKFFIWLSAKTIVRKILHLAIGTNLEACVRSFVRFFIRSQGANFSDASLIKRYLPQRSNFKKLSLLFNPPGQSAECCLTLENTNGASSAFSKTKSGAQSQAF